MDIVRGRDDSNLVWHGELKLPADTSIVPGPFTLTLDDGRTGDIEITKVRSNSDTKSAAAFTGKGPPPQRAPQ
jgi:hypothetical protein